MARKILLADDSVTAQNMGRKILTDAGYDVVTVNNGSAALKRVGEQKPDLIVLDVYMPGYSGLEVCARLKDAPDTSRIPILLTVGKLEPFKPEEASRVRADAFIVKPFEASELLSALTRLEDRMVPMADGARFATTVSGIERFSAESAARKSEPTEEDSGWKSRLRFPSKKKKEEPEPEPEEDFTTVNSRKGVFKAPAPAGTFAVSSTPQAQEPGLVPDIPRDITPEELDALSELVAKLDGPIPASEAVAPLGEKIGPVEMPAATPIAEEAKQEEIKQEAASSAVTEAVSVAEASAPAVEAAPVVEKAEAVPPVTEVAVAPTFAVESPAAEAAGPPSSPVEVITQEPAPVSQVEEFVAGPAAEAAAVIAEEEKKESPVAEALGEVSLSPPSAPDVPSEATTRAVAEEPRAEEPAHIESAPELAAAAPPAAPQVPAPSAEDLAEALRLLTPQTGQTLAEAGAALAEELSRGSSGGTRWVAESVALSPEEASASLESEMFNSFSNRSDETRVSIEAEESKGAAAHVGHEEEEAAEAAVEAAEAMAQDTTAAIVAPVVSEPGAVVASSATSEVTESLPSEPAKQVPVEAVEESGQEEVAAVTFADAVRGEQEAVAVGSTEPVDSGDEPGGAEDMAKDAKGKGKSNWHQIHSAPEAAAKTDAVEAAKQSEEAPKAMAAAAADGGSDPSAIANIVDSVLADLRPKIVEEIAKKLAKR